MIKTNDAYIYSYLTMNCKIDVRDWNCFFQFVIIMSLSPSICIINCIL